MIAATETDRVKVEITATSKADATKTDTCTVTIILKEDARTETNYTYDFIIDKKAETIDVSKGNRTVGVSVESIGKDIETIAAIEWNQGSFKKYWNTEEIKNLIASLVLVEEFDEIVEIQDNLDAIEVIDNTMKVVVKGRTILVTRIDNEDDTTTLDINAGSKKAQIKNIKVVSDETNYTITAAAEGKGQKVRVKAIIAKDASKAEIHCALNDAEMTKAVGIVNSETAYEVELNKTFYNNALGLVGVTDPLPSISVVNCYVPVE
jgi:hypothetical protein